MTNLTAYDYLLKADEYLNRMQKADIELAIELSQKSIDLDPELALAHYTLGLAKLIYQSDWGGPASLIDEAIIAAEKAIESDPSLSHGYFLLGLAYQNKAWIAPFEPWEEKALKAYKQALKVNPDDVNAKNALVNHDHRYKQLGQVLAVLYESLRMHPDSVHIHINIGTIFEDLNYNSVAIEWYEKALLIQPDYYTALLKLCSLHLALGEYDKSLVFAEDLLKRYPDKSDYLFQKAAIYLFKKEFDKAIKLYQRGDINISKDYNLNTGYYIFPTSTWPTPINKPVREPRALN
ncbi:MAG: tetratricopeptide repeat protein [Marinicella sp.]